MKLKITFNVPATHTLCSMNKPTWENITPGPNEKWHRICQIHCWQLVQFVFFFSHTICVSSATNAITTIKKNYSALLSSREFSHWLLVFEPCTESTPRNTNPFESYLPCGRICCVAYSNQKVTFYINIEFGPIIVSKYWTPLSNI